MQRILVLAMVAVGVCLMLGGVALGLAAHSGSAVVLGAFGFALTAFAQAVQMISLASSPKLP